MGPFEYPWLTFLAWIVALGCIVFSIIWALFLYKPKDDGDE